MTGDAVTAWLSARYPPPSRAALERHQARLWRRLQGRFGSCPALACYATAAMADVPVITTTDFRAHFGDYLTRAIDPEAARCAAHGAETGADVTLAGSLSAGFSTGTGGGPRGLFVTSAAERATYAGSLAGKLFAPLELMGLRRIAVCLRAPNRLYDRRQVRFFGLSDAGRDAAMAAWNPQVLIAPPQVLLDMAEAGRPLPALQRLFYGAETLNAAERAFITGRLGRRPDPIYQATEGFLGAPCRLGTLHLNEDALIIERAPLGGDRFAPIVTDLLRRTQLVVRLRLDDILRPVVCPCGSALAAVAPVEGRVQDIWRWPAQTVFPGDVEAVVSEHLAPERRWIATGHPGGIAYACEHDDDAPRLVEALSGFGQALTRESYSRLLDFPKRRHVRWRV